MAAIAAGGYYPRTRRNTGIAGGGLPFGVQTQDTPATAFPNVPGQTLTGNTFDKSGKAIGYTFQGAAPAQPTFQAPQQANPQIAELMAELRKPSLSGASGGSAAPSALPALQAQQGQFQKLLEQLMRGEGITVGPLTNDPEAEAYRIAKRRESEQLRAEEAARLGASGVSGSGDFDVRVRDINEQAGTDIAGFEAGLTGRRRGEALTTALSGAQLQLADLDRQTRAQIAREDADLRRREADERRMLIERQGKQDLLNVLLQQQQYADAESRAKAEEARRAAEFAETSTGKKLARQTAPRTGTVFRSAIR